MTAVIVTATVHRVIALRATTTAVATRDRARPTTSSSFEAAFEAELADEIGDLGPGGPVVLRRRRWCAPQSSTASSIVSTKPVRVRSS